MKYKWTALTVTTVGTLMAGIDSRIVVIGLPAIAQQLHASAEDVVWITQAYVLAGAIFLLFVGRLTDIFGRVKLYNIGFVVFTVGSALAAISPSSSYLIAFRIVQGVGSGILATNAAAIVTDASPRNELGLMLGLNNTAVRVGAMAGLTLSGLILTLVDWRGLFYVNIPIGIFGTVWAHRRLKEISTKDESKQMDWTGAFLFAGGLTLVLLAITYLSYGIASYDEGFAFLAAGLIFILIFIRVESRLEHPVLDLRLFRITLFSAGNIAQILNVMAWSGVLLLIAFYLEIGLGYSPLLAGITVLPLEVSFLVMALVAGRLSDKYGTRLLATLGIAINTLSFLAIAFFSETTSTTQIVAALFGIGIGNGMFAAPNARAIMGSVPPERRGVASAFRQTMNNVGWTVSYGLVILFMTFGIPYTTLSQLLQGSTTQLTLLAKTEFFNGFHIAVLGLTAIDAVAIIPSALRGPKQLLSEDEIKIE
ncbi:MAG: MFS transporter [Nitrososphaerota archaeon]|nr:MFS transporter [Nitrososphaerota archaeon]